MNWIQSVKPFGADELLARLERTRLRGHGQPLIYADADLRLETISPEELRPAQAYILFPNIRQVRALREALLPHGIDTYRLEGGAWITTIDARIPVIPPIVEESVEACGRSVLLINDGIHRIAAARENKAPITVVVARGVRSSLPYYAYPLAGGWDETHRFEELPAEFEKRKYRQPTGYQALVRNFNAEDVFPGVQAERKNTNPPRLTP